MPVNWHSEEIEKIVRNALAEDIGPGDVSTAATTPPRAVARAHILARQTLVCAGLPLAENVFRALDPETELIGHSLRSSQCLCRVLQAIRPRAGKALPSPGPERETHSPPAAVQHTQASASPKCAPAPRHGAESSLPCSHPLARYLRLRHFERFFQFLPNASSRASRPGALAASVEVLQPLAQFLQFNFLLCQSRFQPLDDHLRRAAAEALVSKLFLL